MQPSEAQGFPPQEFVCGVGCVLRLLWRRVFGALPKLVVSCRVVSCRVVSCRVLSFFFSCLFVISKHIVTLLAPRYTNQESD